MPGNRYLCWYDAGAGTYIVLRAPLQLVYSFYLLNLLNECELQSIVFCVFILLHYFVILRIRIRIPSRSMHIYAFSF